LTPLRPKRRRRRRRRRLHRKTPRWLKRLQQMKRAIEKQAKREAAPVVLRAGRAAALGREERAETVARVGDVLGR
jgi:hypothetical protein